MSHTEPRTEAGKRLDTAWPGTHLDRLAWRQAVVAIEMEADAAVDRLALPQQLGGDGLREAASRYRKAEWDIRCNEDAIRDEAHNARVEEWRAADAAVAVLLGESSPFRDAP